MHRDLVLRWIATLSALIARLLRREPGVTIAMAREQLEDARGMLLGSAAILVERLEPAAAAALLAEPYRIWGLAELLALESALERADGRPAEADALARRAADLAREAIARVDPVPPEWTRWLAAVERDLGPPLE